MEQGKWILDDDRQKLKMGVVLIVNKYEETINRIKG